jgi:hypothetical protein
MKCRGRNSGLRATLGNAHQVVSGPVRNGSMTTAYLPGGGLQRKTILARKPIRPPYTANSTPRPPQKLGRM